MLYLDYNSTIRDIFRQVEEISLNRESGTVYCVQANSGTAPATVGG